MEENQVVELCYQLPEAAHERLCHTREEIRLLADLTARISGEAHHLQLSPSALARCFDSRRRSKRSSTVLPPSRSVGGQRKSCNHRLRSGGK